MRAGERAQLTRLADTESLAATVLEGVSEGLGLIESELVADSELVGVCDSEESQGIRRGQVSASSEHRRTRPAPVPAQEHWFGVRYR